MKPNLLEQGQFVLQYTFHNPSNCLHNWKEWTVKIQRLALCGGWPSSPSSDWKPPPSWRKQAFSTTLVWPHKISTLVLTNLLAVTFSKTEDLNTSVLSQPELCFCCFGKLSNGKWAIWEWVRAKISDFNRLIQVSHLKGGNISCRLWIYELVKSFKDQWINSQHFLPL